ncbi:hypothetical protein HMPREF9353_02287 [Treponema denticola F0402]|nr:hypothetical protein [Treponema denticola]EGC76492.1 hypothetical protein HMPREF9353_02287 [Treponema denticola F0402]
MVNMTNFFVPLAKKTDFNVSVKHIQSVIEILEDCDPKENIADKINLMIREQTIKPEQVRSILSVSLLDKWNYKVVSENLKFILDDASSFVAEVAKWSGIDLVFGYDHPDLGFIVINPKNPAAAQVIQGFRKNELLLIFVGKQDRGSVDAGLADSVISAIHKLFEKKTCSVPASVKAGPFVYVEPKKAAPVKVKKAVTKKPGKKLRLLRLLLRFRQVPFLHIWSAHLPWPQDLKRCRSLFLFLFQMSSSIMEMLKHGRELYEVILQNTKMPKLWYTMTESVL